MAKRHGESKTKLYIIWKGMKARCNYPSTNYYSRYGGRGIKVCPDWQESYEAFRRWAHSNGYIDGLEIDRLNNDMDYSPDNCRWSTRNANMRNTSRARMLTAYGESKSLMDWVEDSRCKVNYDTLKQRVHDGYKAEAALSDKYSLVRRASNKYLIEALGEAKSMAEWSRDIRCKCEYQTLRGRYNKSHDMAIALAI